MRGLKIPHKDKSFKKHELHIIKNVIYAGLGIASAVVLAKLGVFESILQYSKNVALVGSVAVGFFFPSILTIAPSVAALTEIASAVPIVLVAFLASIGATFGDIVLFFFLRDKLDNNFLELFKKPKIKRWVHIVHLETFRWTLPFLGAILLASPLPDEIGLSILGFSRIRFLTFVFLSYAMNFINILILVSAVRLIG